jgi:hypothetical protein
MRYSKIVFSMAGPFIFLLIILGVACQTPAANKSRKAYSLVPDEHGMILKAPDGRVVFRYMTKKPKVTNLAANSVCCFHPLNTPSGERLTDLAPGDHHHHRGVFLAWHTMGFREKADFSSFGPLGPTYGWNISRGDFWGWGEFAPTKGRVIKNREVKLVGANAEVAELKIRNDWVTNEKVMMTEATSAKLREQDGVYVIDLDYNLTPVVDLILNHTAFGGFCVRARNDGESYYATCDGKVLLPDPHYSVPELNWPAANWYDYTIKLNNGKTVGCAVLDHPDNPPSTWHNPRYVWMVNPCIAAAGPFTVEKGDSLSLRYRLVVHDGPTPVGLLEGLSNEWQTSSSAARFRLERDFVRLDNGKDLTGWKGNMRDWSVVHGGIHLHYKSPPSGGVLFSEKTHSDNVIIRMQFRATYAADSGVFVHGSQFQVRDYINSYPDTKKYAPYCNPPGVWNNLEFDITNGVAVIKLNGTVIERAWKIGTRANQGIGLQKEKGDFDFRYIRLKET